MSFDGSRNALCSEGCGGSYNRVDPLGGGYQETALTYNIPQVNRKDLKLLFQYQTPNGKQVTIWPSVSSGPIIKDNVAIFVGKCWLGNRENFGERWIMGYKVVCR